jgi:hypothetical protein
MLSDAVAPPQGQCLDQKCVLCTRSVTLAYHLESSTARKSESFGHVFYFSIIIEGSAEGTEVSNAPDLATSVIGSWDGKERAGMDVIHSSSGRYTEGSGHRVIFIEADCIPILILLSLRRNTEELVERSTRITLLLGRIQSR